MQPAGERGADQRGGIVAAILIVIALLFALAGTAAALAAISPGNSGDDRYGEALRELDQTLIELEHLDERTSETAVRDAREKASVAARAVHEAAGADTHGLAEAFEALDRAFAALPEDASGPEAAGAIREEVIALRAAWHQCFTRRG